MTDRPSGRGPGAKRLGRVYQGAVEAVVALLIAIGLGFWADERFDTAPYLILLGTVLGFGAMVRRLFRMRSLVEPEESESSDPNRRVE